MKNFSKTSLPLLLMLLFSGCSTCTTEPSENDFDTARRTSGAVMARATAMSDSAAANSIALSKEKSPYNFGSSSNRKISYNTRLAISVADVRKSLQKSCDIAEKHGGYAVRMDDSYANIKIPVNNARTALTEIEKLGKVTSRKISANDVTAKHTDINVRLENLSKLQKRLAELLKRAEKVEEILKIEKELSRVTTDLERCQAQMKLLLNSVENVDIHISFNAASPQQEYRRSIVPASWIKNLGKEIFRTKFVFSGDDFDGEPAKAALPDGFIILKSNDDILLAADNRDNVIAIKNFSNVKNAGISFYTPLIKRQLSDTGFVNIKNSSGKNQNNYEYALICSEKGKYSYYIQITTFEDGWLFREQKITVTELLCEKGSLKDAALKKFFDSVTP